MKQNGSHHRRMLEMAESATDKRGSSRSQQQSSFILVFPASSLSGAITLSGKYTSLSMPVV